MKPEDEVLTVKEVAAALRVNPQTVRRLYDLGELQGFKVLSERKIYAASVAAFKERHANRRPVEEKVIPRRGPRKKPPVPQMEFTFLRHFRPA